MCGTMYSVTSHACKRRLVKVRTTMLGCMLLAASLLAAPVFADETEVDQAETENAGDGTGLFALELQEDDSIGILWKDDTFGNYDVNMFVKAE